ncbi:MAG TPA: NAD(P)-binding domain-containing protein [Polyangiaceae bacterium]|jgi:predicted dinucleotide-binding enzyme|nr:NAD(P)-binding domain-containing protein [Polyangiaceae bacterium]
MAKKVGVLGSGVVGQALADGFLKHGYQVMRGSRDVTKLGVWMHGAGPHASVGSFAEAARFGDLVVLAVKGGAAQAVVDQCDGHLAGKTVIDTTNPIADAPPENGVIKFFTSLDDSLMERLQRHLPNVHFVKAFSCVGNAFMVDPDFNGQKPTMFLCGNDAGAKSEVIAVLKEFGWEIEDMGAATAARAIEPLCMLWCIPGLTQKGWAHAFKLLRK